MELRNLVRTVLIGRPDGVRAAVRRQTGWFTWLDEAPADSTPPPPPAPAAHGPTPDREGWVSVLPLAELPEGEPVEVFAEGQVVVLVRLGSDIHALDGVCAHAGGPLGEGTVEGPMLTCPWHGWSYDVRTGATPMRDEVCLRRFEVKSASGRVWLRV